jgi:hypothetical protein
LLERLLPSQDIDALLGDIDEEARRRSPFWYWGQIVAAIVVGSYRAVRKHPFLALRAVGVGLLTLVVVFAPAPRLLHVVRVMSEGAGHYGKAQYRPLTIDHRSPTTEFLRTSPALALQMLQRLTR